MVFFTSKSSTSQGDYAAALPPYSTVSPISSSSAIDSSRSVRQQSTATSGRSSSRWLIHSLQLFLLCHLPSNNSSLAAAAALGLAQPWS